MAKSAFNISDGLHAKLDEMGEALKSVKSSVVLNAQIVKLIEEIDTSLKKGGKLLLCGNGGFASTSQHVATELIGKLNAVRGPIGALSLCSDTSTITCIANDFGFEKIFSRQIEALGTPEDVVILLTTSGKSKNILEAAETASRKGMATYAFTGKKHGKLLRELGAETIEIPSGTTDTIQDVTLALLHFICAEIERRNPRNEDRIWQRVESHALDMDKETLLLDRDGVVNLLKPNAYVTCTEAVEMNPSFLKGCNRLASAYRKIFIVSNQACIGKGIATREEIDKVNDKILEEIRNAGGRIDEVYICADTGESACRKPEIGMFEEILRDHPEVDPGKTVMVGDSYSDRLFAQRVGATYIDITEV